MRKWMMKREGFLLYTINPSLNYSSDFLAFQRHKHHEGESSHSRFTQVLQCTCQDSFLAGFYLQRSVGQAPLEAAPSHSDLCFPAQKKPEKGGFGIHQFSQLTLCPSCYISATRQWGCCHISLYFESP